MKKTFKQASLVRRLFADCLDIGAFIVLFLLVYLSLFSYTESFQGKFGSGYIYGMIFPTIKDYSIILMSWIIFITLTEYRTGQSIGKRMTRIKVIKENLGGTTFLTTLIRHLFDLVDLIMLLGLLVAISNKNRQRIGDLIAKTVVVSKF